MEERSVSNDSRGLCSIELCPGIENQYCISAVSCIVRELHVMAWQMEL